MPPPPGACPLVLFWAALYNLNSPVPFRRHGSPARDAPADVTNACIRLFETTERAVCVCVLTMTMTRAMHWLGTQARSRVGAHTRFIQGKRPPSVVRGAGVQPKVFSPLYVTYRKPSSSLWSS